MATATHHPNTTDRPEPAAVFSRVIEDNPLVCSRCYKRTHEETEFSELYQQLYPVGDAYRWRTPITSITNPPTRKRANIVRTACYCGSLNRHTGRSNSVCRDRLMVLGYRVSKRLREFEIEHSRRVLVDVVWELKRVPRYASRDSWILWVAVMVAIRQTQ